MFPPDWVEGIMLLLGGAITGVAAYITLRNKVQRQTSEEWKGLAEVRETKLQTLQAEFDMYRRETDARIFKLEGALEALTNLKVPTIDGIASAVWSNAPPEFRQNPF